MFKQNHLALATACLGLTLAAPAQAAPAEQIRKLEAQVNAAYAANDLPKYFAFYAEDLRALFPDGATTLPKYRQSWTAFIKSGGAIERFTYDDLQVQISPAGDCAVASYSATATTRNPGKAASDEHFFETDVWFKRAGHWKIVEIHYSPVESPAK